MQWRRGRDEICVFCQHILSLLWGMQPSLLPRLPILMQGQSVTIFPLFYFRTTLALFPMTRFIIYVFIASMIIYCISFVDIRMMSDIRLIVRPFSC